MRDVTAARSGEPEPPVAWVARVRAHHHRSEETASGVVLFLGECSERGNDVTGQPEL
jgi:hypothetical protein